MNGNPSLRFQWLAGSAPLLLATALCAAPLTWFPGPSLNFPISGAVAVVVSDKSNILIGGDSYNENFPQSLAATNLAWTYLPALYCVRIAPGAVAGGGMIIVYGGSDGTNSTSSVLGYSPSGDTPLTLASMSVARSYLGYAADAGGNAYAFGGLDDKRQPLSSAERYNSDTDTWVAIAPLPAAQYNFPAVFDGANQIYVFGGRTNTVSGTETAMVLRFSITSKTWAPMASMPIATAGSAAVLGKDGKIYVVGGLSGGVPTNMVQVYTPASNSWVISKPLPQGLSLSAMSVDSLGWLIVMGGVDAGGSDIGNVWRSQQLGVPDSAPTFTQYPGTNGKYLAPYTSTISAAGNPQPIYLLLSGPDGMQVDAYSGAITWTPHADQIGSNSVAVRATNYAGFADWNFTITVPNPPPTIPTNLTVVSLTDNSVTLSWDPESLAVGPVAYSVHLRHSVHSPRGSGVTVWYTQIGSNTTLPTITITGLMPGMAQVYYVSAVGPGGTSGYGPGIAATTTAPQGPPALFVTGLTSTSVSLAWNPSPGPGQDSRYSQITSYSIMERKLSVSPPQNIPTVTNIIGTNGTITGLKPGGSHLWYVAGVDAYGNASGLGSVYVVVTNPVPVMLLVSGAGTLSNGDFHFTVQEAGSIIQTVLIEANTNLADQVGWVQISSVLANATAFTFTDTNSAQYPTRFYRIRAP